MERTFWRSRNDQNAIKSIWCLASSWDGTWMDSGSFVFCCLLNFMKQMNAELIMLLCVLWWYCQFLVIIIPLTTCGVKSTKCTYSSSCQMVIRDIWRLCSIRLIVSGVSWHSEFIFIEQNVKLWENVTCVDNKEIHDKPIYRHLTCNHGDYLTKLMVQETKILQLR